MKWITAIARNSLFLGALFALFFGAAVTSTLWALQLSSKVAVMSASAAVTAVQHREAIARAVARTKAKARIRRVIASIPVVGAVAFVYFEDQDLREWLEENPGKTRADYACEVAHLSAETVDEVLADLPQALRPHPEFVLGRMHECTDLDYSIENGEAE